MKESKKQKIIPIILSLSLILVVIGVSYAAFVYTGKGTKENTLTTGTVSFVYNETSNGVSITNAYPMEDSKGKLIQDTGEDITKGYFDFEVKSTLGSDTIIPYYVYSVDTTEDKATELDSEYVKVYLTNQQDTPYEQYNKEKVPVYSELEDIKGTGTDNQETEGKLLYQDTFYESGRKDFRLRLWVSNDYEVTEEEKKFKMRVDVSTDAKVIPKDQNKPTCEVVEKDPQTIGANEEVQLTIKCTDDNGTVTSNMTKDNIQVKVNNEVVEPTKKELSEGIAATEVTGENGIQHTLTLSGFEKDGPISLTIDEGVVTDQYGNTNDEQNLDTNLKIIIDAEGPVCTLEEYFPTKTITKDKTVELTIQCTDESEITQDLTEEGLKVTVGDEEEEELTKEITNTETIEKGKKYTVEVKGFTKTGKIGATINEGTLQDSLQNSNKETPLDIDLEIANKEQSPEDLIDESNSSDTEYNEETKDKMFEFTHDDGSVDYRYIGSTEKNYVNLLGTDDGKTDENLWRIIGVFEEENAEGVKEKRIKLILNERLNNTNYAWDNNGNNGSNNWTRPAAINTILNGAFWDATSESCPNGGNNATTSCSFTSYKMNTVQDKIETMKWYLGGTNTASQGAEAFYKAERGSTVPSGASSTTTGNVGLAYPSDYGYTYGAGFGTTTCFQSGLGSCNSETTKSWMYKSGYHWWTLTPRSSYTYAVFYVYSNGYVKYDYASYTYGVRPVVYLKSSIGITGGEGTKDEPYTVGEKTVADLDTKAPTCSIISITPERPTVEDEVQIKIKCRDDSGRVNLKSELTKEEIEVKINGTDTSATKELSSANETEDSIEYTLTLNNFDKAGSLSLIIPEGKVTDYSGNTNIKTSLTAGKVWGNSQVDKFTKEHTNDSESTWSNGDHDSMFEFTHDGRTDYRYIGNTEKNYVNLIGGDAGKTDANLWRIIGVFDDPSADEGTIGTKKIKLIKDKPLGNYSWDNANEITYTSGSTQRYYGANSWERPSAIKTALNQTFWNSTIGQCPLCNSDFNIGCQNSPTTACNFSSNGLKNVQDKIENMKWYLGGTKINNQGAEVFYKAERGSTPGKYTGSKTTGTGHVGLMYPSDYGYTYGAGFGTTTCFQSDFSTCDKETTKSWLFNSDYQWTITPISDHPAAVFRVNSNGTVDMPFAYSTYGVRPVVYLKSTIGITGGKGTKTEPYTVGEVS